MEGVAPATVHCLCEAFRDSAQCRPSLFRKRSEPCHQLQRSGGRAHRTFSSDFDLCHLIKAKTIHVVRPALQSQELMLLEAFQRKDVSAYMGLNIVVNNSSAMMELKYKQAVICEQEHKHTSFHTHSCDTLLTSRTITIKLDTHGRSHAAARSPQTHTRLLCVHKKHTNVQTEVRCENSNFSKCLEAHNRGAKTTNGHMSRDNQQILKGVYQENPNTAKCVSAKFTWSSQSF